MQYTAVCVEKVAFVGVCAFTSIRTEYPWKVTQETKTTECLCGGYLSDEGWQ